MATSYRCYNDDLYAKEDTKFPLTLLPFKPILPQTMGMLLFCNY